MKAIHLNTEWLMRLHEQDIAGPTYTMRDGRFAIRVAHTHHRTRYEDFDRLVRKVVRLGQAIVLAGAGAAAW